MSKNVLVLGPSKKTRGGITSVINAYKSSVLWNRWRCIWIETYVDKNAFCKILYFLKGLLVYTVHIPNAKIVHVHFSGKVSLMRKSVFVLFAKIFSVPIVSHLHAFSLENTIHGKYSWLYDKIFRSSDVVIVLSNYWKKEIMATFCELNNIRVIHNPCVAVKDDKLNEENIILYAGTLNSRKGYPDLIDAFSRIADLFPDWKIIFAGNGELEKGKALARKFGVENQVIFIGWVNGNEKSNIFKKAKIFCLPSYAEGFPMAILDAWSYRLPIITTPVGGLQDILISDKNSLVFEPGDKERLSKHIKRLIIDEKLRKDLSRESERLSKNEFNLSKIVDEIDKIYKNVIGI